MRVLIAGWPSFPDGEATAGDVASMHHVAESLWQHGISSDCAWSPNFRPDGAALDDLSPGDYTHLVFVCGPAHGRQVERLHSRFPECRRLAVGVTVIDPDDPAVIGFHAVFPRDGADSAPSRDLTVPLAPPARPVFGVVTAPAQPEYGARRRHDEVHRALYGWLSATDCAPLPLDTRLDPGNWRHCSTVDQFVALVDRTDLVVTTRLHGLVFALARGVPALAVDPVAGGGKVTAQAAAWHWPVVTADALLADPAVLDGASGWCLSALGRAAARTRADGGGSPLIPALLDDLLAGAGCAPRS
ncbi:polysaccharide pyruvyl transferase family protein [Saccharopolyspora rosea]|uniref:Polysaccharide pyruvyl transferase family protein n=1 Tax=Saccharopolyspora rosea TaxID=524884 RepID=A0ABW3FZX1_9PSEU